MASTGNAIDFGIWLSAFSAGLSNATRGVMNGASASLDYVTIASTEMHKILVQPLYSK